jgi:hypothetical protein
MKHEIFQRKDMKDGLVTFTVASFAMLLPPFIIIYFFEQGIWLSICLLFYFACCGGYASFQDTLFPKIKICKSIDDRTANICVSICISVQIILIVLALFPFALMSETFIRYIDIVFNLDFSTCYEGGIIVTLLTLLIIIVLIDNLVSFYSSTKDNTKEIQRGLVGTSIFFALIITFSSLRIHYCDSDKYHFIQTQSERESNQLDQDIQHYKMQKYKKFSDHLYE